MASRYHKHHDYQYYCCNFEAQESKKDLKPRWPQNRLAITAALPATKLAHFSRLACRSICLLGVWSKASATTPQILRRAACLWASSPRETARKPSARPRTKWRARNDGFGRTLSR